MAPKHPCTHRGKPTGEERPCVTCGSRGTLIPLYTCTLHERCTIEKQVNGMPTCKSCRDRTEDGVNLVKPLKMPRPVRPQPKARPQPIKHAVTHSIAAPSPPPGFPRSRDEMILALDGPPRSDWPDDWQRWSATIEAHTHLFRQEKERVLLTESPLPTGQGRGIVTCGGGPVYYTCAYVLCHLLRHLGCELAIEVWHLGPGEMPDESRQVLERFGHVHVRDCLQATHEIPRILGGWEAKLHAIRWSQFREVLFLDADQIPVIDPTYLFNIPEYHQKALCLWPDRRTGGGLDIDALAFRACGVPIPAKTSMPQHSRPADYRPCESGQILVCRETRWQWLLLAQHICNHADWYWRGVSQGKGENLIYGDKSACLLASLALGEVHKMPLKDPGWVGNHEGGAFLQHDFEGRIFTQHRCQPAGVKWRLHGENRNSNLTHWDVCMQALDNLRTSQLPRSTTFLPDGKEIGQANAINVWREISELNCYRLPAKFDPEDVIVDVGAHQGFFAMECLRRGAGHVHCIEPEPSNFAILSRNLAEFRDRVTLWPAAAWHKTESLYLDYPDGAKHDAGGCVLGTTGVPVLGIPLDEVLHKIGKPIRLLKLDCEGAEWHILAGLDSHNLATIQAIAGEYHETPLIWMGSRMREGMPEFSLDWLKWYLEQSGFTVEIEPNLGTTLLGNFFATRG